MVSMTLQHYDLAGWRTAVNEHFGRIEISAPADFSASMSVARLGDVSLMDMSTTAHTVTRSASDADPFCKLSLQLEGTSTMTQDGRTCVLEPGDLALYVTQRPYSLAYDSPQRTLVVYLPLSFLSFTPAQISALTASPITRHSGLGRVAIPMFEQLAANINLLDGAHAEALVRSAINMLISVFSSEYASELADGSGPLLFQQAKSYIEDNLSHPDLSPATIAAALYVSVRHLHAQFASQGLTVSAYVRDRRLERIRADLANPALSSRSITSVCADYGINDASYFSRIFKNQYGHSPREFRKLHA
ncbi:AraC-like ligand-binding domain-containing protein [Corynebacterium sp. H130]|uniref:AraC-like ligand-binding domain-containing protein n=1 Tax=Corynebacterium sp. H130 TaxID=3133444 RepID=UPI00403FB8EE